jgi:protein TonB
MRSVRLSSGLALVLALAVSSEAHSQTPSENNYRMSPVEVEPALANRREVGELVQREYPAALRNAGIGGTVTVKFAVEANGRVDASSITVVSSDQEQLAEPARRVVQRMRFRPAENLGKPVRVMISLPLQFRPPPPADAQPAASGTAP